jgi:hypothetical protein
MDPAGTRGPEGGAAASGPSSAISGITKGGGGGRRSSTPGFLRAAPWEKASLTSGSGERDQNPGNGSLCSRRHGRRQKTGAGTDGRGRAHPGGPRKPQAIASAPPSNGISSDISNGISSGILWRASRMARAGEGTRRPWAMAPPSPPEGSRLARVCFPRPDPDVSEGFPCRSGIAVVTPLGIGDAGRSRIPPRPRYDRSTRWPSPASAADTAAPPAGPPPLPARPDGAAAR